MFLKMRSFNSVLVLNMFLLIAAAIVAPIHGLDSRKLDESTVPTPTGEKCSPCTPSSPPPPSPPPPCPPPPPPPSPPPPVLPPPSPKKPPSSYCPPPPPVQPFIYITGPPGDLYPVVNDFSGAGQAVGLPALIGCGLLALLVRFGI